MRKRILHIALFYCLLGNILFSQVIVGFFHHHDEQGHVESVFKKSGQNKTVLTKQSPHCKVCSFDILHELFYKENIRFDLSYHVKDEYQIIGFNFNTRISAFHQDRAPPVFSSYLI